MKVLVRAWNSNTINNDVAYVIKWRHLQLIPNMHTSFSGFSCIHMLNFQEFWKYDTIGSHLSVHDGIKGVHVYMWFHFAIWLVPPEPDTRRQTTLFYVCVHQEKLCCCISTSWRKTVLYYRSLRLLHFPRKIHTGKLWSSKAYPWIC